MLLPLRPVVESCGGTVEYASGPPPRGLVAFGGGRGEVTVGEALAQAGGRPLTLPVAPAVWEDTLVVPAEFLRALGLSVQVEEPAQAVLCGCPNPRLAGRRVFLDPGHGGSDQGAIGPRGIREAEVTLEVARQAASLLASAGAQASLSRNSDRTLSLAARLTLAQARRAAVLVSVHCNSFSDPAAHGTETYYYEAWEGHKLAAEVQQELVGELGLTDRGVKEAAFYVLRNARCPACLTELAFLSNPDEEALLADAWVRLRAALALFRGVRAFLDRAAELA